MLFLLFAFTLICQTIVYAEPLPPDVRDIYVYYQNLERYTCELDYLQWDLDLADLSNEYSESCFEPYFNGSNPYHDLGYNTFESNNTRFNPVMAVSSWLAEKINWECGSIETNETTNYHQIMWEDTTKFGCSMSNCNNSSIEYRILCLYSNKANSGYPPFSVMRCPISSESEGEMEDPIPDSDMIHTSNSSKVEKNAFVTGLAMVAWGLR